MDTIIGWEISREKGWGIGWVMGSEFVGKFGWVIEVG
jgi:hypothetical protein